MKKLTILLFSILISFNSYGEWTTVVEGDSVTQYVDIGAIKKDGNTVYWWEMKSHLKPISDTNWLSITFYTQGDCAMNRIKVLAFNTYTKPMAKGVSKSIDISSKWRYPEPMTISHTILETACPERP